MSVVLLESADGEIFCVETKVLKCAVNIMRVLKHYEGKDPFPLSRISSRILRKVITWAEYHKNNAVPSENEITADNISSWEADFLDVDPVTLSDLKVAALSLGVKGLRLTCEAVANMAKGKTSETSQEK